MKEKEKKKYDVKKKKKQRKLAQDMTPRESRCARNKWKKYSADHYKKKKKAQDGFLLTVLLYLVMRSFLNKLYHTRGTREGKKSIGIAVR